MRIATDALRRGAPLLLLLGFAMIVTGSPLAAVMSLGPSPVLNSCDDPDRTLGAAIADVNDLLGYEVDVSLDESILALPDTAPYGFQRGSFLGDSTFFFVTKLSEGSYRITHTKLGPPGNTGAGDLFSMTGDPAGETAVDMLVSLSTIDGRDSFNQTVDIDLGPAAIVRVDCTAPVVSIEEMDRSCFHGSAYSDPIQGTVEASDTGGIGADLDRIDYQFIAGTDPCDPGGTWTNLLGGLSGLAYGPGVENLPDPPTGGEWTIYLRAVDDAGNVSDCAGYTFVYLAGPPPAVTNFAASARYRAIHLEWTLPTLLPTQEIRIVRKHWNNDGSGGYAQYLLNDVLEGGDYPVDLSDGIIIHTTTSGTEFLDEVGDVTTGPEIFLYRAFVIDCLDTVNAGDSPTSISADFTDEELTDAVDAACNYWLGDMDDLAGTPYIQDGYVTAADLTALSGSYNLIDGDVGFVPEADFGPSAMPTGSPTGVARPDNQVNFEDLNLLAMNYLVVEPAEKDLVTLGPIVSSTGTPRLELQILRDSNPTTGHLAARLYLSDHANEVRGIRAIVAYDHEGLELVDYQLAERIADHPGAAFALLVDHAEGKEFAVVTLGPNRSFEGSGPVCDLKFRAVGDGSTGLALEGVRLRDMKNRELANGEESSDFDLEIPRVPVVQGFDQRTLKTSPNPFRDNTEIVLVQRQDAAVSVSITDLSGRRIRVLWGGHLMAGEHLFGWDGTDDHGRSVPAGIYYCELRTENGRFARKILCLR